VGWARRAVPQPADQDVSFLNFGGHVLQTPLPTCWTGTYDTRLRLGRPLSTFLQVDRPYRSSRFRNQCIHLSVWLSSGNVINVVTKSGSKPAPRRCLGSFYRNNSVGPRKTLFSVRARNPASPANQFGGTVGGPIRRKQKTFLLRLLRGPAAGVTRNSPNHPCPRVTNGTVTFRLSSGAPTGQVDALGKTHHRRCDLQSVSVRRQITGPDRLTPAPVFDGFEVLGFITTDPPSRVT